MIWVKYPASNKSTKIKLSEARSQVNLSECIIKPFIKVKGLELMYEALK